MVHELAALRDAGEIVVLGHPDDAIPLPVRLRLLRDVVPGTPLRIAPTAIPQTKLSVEVFARWEEIHPAFRPWCARRVLLTGPESTGKTSLAVALSEALGYSVVPEYLREFWQARGGCSFEDLEGIAATQIAREYAATKGATRGMVCDTSPLSTWVYAQHYFGRTTSALDRWASLKRYDAILFLDDDLPWVQDGVRDSVLVRTATKHLFLQALNQQKAPYHVIRGLGEERLGSALEALKQSLVVL